jgi:hypothetical protein
MVTIRLSDTEFAELCGHALSDEARRTKELISKVRAAGPEQPGLQVVQVFPAEERDTTPAEPWSSAPPSRAGS